MKIAYGKVCARHPELNGARRASKRDCVACHKASIAKYNARPECRARKNAASYERNAVLREQTALRRAELARAREETERNRPRFAPKIDWSNHAAVRKYHRDRAAVERLMGFASDKKARRVRRARQEEDYAFLAAKALRRYPVPRASRAELQAAWESQRGRCGLTGALIPPGVRPHIDHKVPAASGGASTIDNLHFTHPMANLAKNSHSTAEFQTWLLAAADSLRAMSSPSSPNTL